LQAIIASDYPVRDAFLEEEDQYSALGMLLLAIQSAWEAAVYNWCLHADWMLGCSCAFTIHSGAALYLLTAAVEEQWYGPDT
jgi:hypothetical protein